MATMFTIVSLSFLCFATLAKSLQTGTEDFDFQIQTITRHIDLDSLQMTYELAFTSSFNPDFHWSYYDQRLRASIPLPGTSEYANGQGTIRYTGRLKLYIKLRIGKFDTHYYDMWLRILSFNGTVTQVLNTQSAASSVGDDVAYSPDDTSLEVVFTSPRRVAEGFDYSKFWSNNRTDVRLALKFANKRGSVSIDDNYDHEGPRINRYAQVDETIGEEEATLRVTVTPQPAGRPAVNGFFEQFTLFDKVEETDDDLVREIWEYRFVTIHEASIRGPFPENFAFIRTSTPRKSCGPLEVCWFYCHGYGNTIQSAQIIKEEEDGSTRTLSAPEATTDFDNEHDVTLSADLNLNSTGDYYGKYLCRINTDENRTVQTEILVMPDTE